MGNPPISLAPGFYAAQVELASGINSPEYILEREVAAFTEHGRALLGDKTANPGKYNRGTTLLILRANSHFQLFQLGEGKLEGRTRLTATPMAP